MLAPLVVGSCKQNESEDTIEKPTPIIGQWMMRSIDKDNGEFDGEIEFHRDGTFSGSDLLGSEEKGIWKVTAAGHLRTEYTLESGFVAKEWDLEFEGDECALTNIHEGWRMRFVRKK